MQLYYSESLSPRKVCALARYLEADIEFVFVDFARGDNRSPAFQKLNPNQKVPVLVEDHRSLWESNAIMCRLAQITRSPLWPGDEEQAEVIRWLSWDTGHFSRFGGELYFECIIKPHIGLGSTDDGIVAEAQQGFRCSAKILEANLGCREWVVGDQLTIADFALGSTLPYAAEASIPLADFPNIARWHNQLCEFDAWRNPFPSRSPNS